MVGLVVRIFTGNIWVIAVVIGIIVAGAVVTVILEGDDGNQYEFVCEVDPGSGHDLCF